MDRHSKIRTYNWSRLTVMDHRLPPDVGTVTVSDFFEHSGCSELNELLKEMDKTARRDTWIEEQTGALAGLPTLVSSS